MTFAPAVRERNIKNAAAWSKDLCQAAGAGRNRLIQPFFYRVEQSDNRKRTSTIHCQRQARE